ncbi:hypothetical protein PENTCL1PPCAC_13865 [Pristionchus entomophagus]|uniref:glucuronosyltransferase n=1 Tax=Pristionchus entomophagus TaxID=358040 RepID=A0AAV5T9A3_9BILA|nr:hypothetical protein PENTCL1PPCAC_13865 [Pristionchus entomophagus]
MRLPVFLLVSITNIAHTHKILVYNPVFGHSMSNFMGSIADTLVDAGHDVVTHTSLISIIDPELRDGTTKAKKVIVKQSEETKNLYDDFEKTKTDFFAMNNYSPLGAYFVGRFFGKLFATQCSAILDEPGLIERLKSQQFDVMIVENFDMCGVALTEVLQPKAFIGSSSNVAFGPQMEEFGIPAFPSFDPSLYTSGMDVHSIWDRLLNLYADFIVRWSYHYMRTDIDDLFRDKFGSAIPSVQSIASQAAFNFINSEPLIDFATTTVSKAIHIGGIGVGVPKPLSSDWEAIFSLRDKTVLLSFGSVCKSIYLSAEIKRSILETIQQLPDITFIWKYEEEDDFTRNEAAKFPNLVLSKWMPQSDLLNHPKLTAFITHGGMGSTLEMARAGVPAIIIPLFADQPRNAAMLEHNGLGKILDKFEVRNSTKFAATIREVIGNERYRQKAEHISAMLQKKPHTAKELVVKHVEFAAEFGAATALRPLSHEMSWIEYRNADIILVGGLISVVSAFGAITMIMYLLKYLIKKTKRKVE